jgi:hypothetical protein
MGCYESDLRGPDPDAGADGASSAGRKDKGNGKGKPGTSAAGGNGSTWPFAECDDDAGPEGPPQLAAHTIQLWPPNHKFHEIAIEDCVTPVDPCDRDLQAEFVWASSDEPVDAKGDGHHAPDILLSDDCRTLSVRSERQGPSDGRVYKIGVRVVDGDGQVSTAECSVVIDHDQRGVEGADSGEAYRVRFDGSDGQASCDGVPPPPPPATPTPDEPT